MNKTIDLPIVDLDDADSRAVLVGACKTVGFFYLKSPLHPKLLQAAFAQSKAFFALDLADKMTVLADPESSLGYTPMEEETLDPANQTKGDTKEGFYIRREIEPSGGSDGAENSGGGGGDSGGGGGAQLEAPNRWPSEALLPGWRATMLEYYGAMMDVGLRTARLLAEGIGCEPGFFEPFFTRSMSALRLLRYAPEVSDASEGVFGCGAHTDYGLLTFLATDDVPGLQVWLDGTWHDVPPKPGHFVVNLGDMLERWCNDALKSTRHRVVNREGRERFSIPFFFETNFDTVVEALPPFVGPDNPPRYPPTTSGEHLLLQYAKTHANFKLTEDGAGRHGAGGGRHGADGSGSG